MFHSTLGTRLFLLTSGWSSTAEGSVATGSPACGSWPAEGLLHCECVQHSHKETTDHDKPQSTPGAVVWIAVDVAKDGHEALIEAPGWKSRKKLCVQNTAKGFRAFAEFLDGLVCPFGLVLNRRATTIGHLRISSTRGISS
jgi:hypothetical protein